MRLLMIIAGTLCLCAGTGRAADDEDQATVRSMRKQYTAALLKRDKVTLQALVHERYEGRSLPGFPEWRRAIRRKPSLTGLTQVQPSRTWMGKSKVSGYSETRPSRQAPCPPIGRSTARTQPGPA